MSYRNKILLLVCCNLITSSISASAALVVADFDSLSAGSVGNTELNNVTTGGSWTLNTSRGATFTAQVENADPGPSGDVAILMDDTDGTTDGGPPQVFATLNFSSAADFSTNDVTVDFRTATRRAGPTKGLRYEFFNGVTSVAQLDWEEVGALTLTGTNTDTGNSSFEFLFEWIHDGSPGGVRDLSFTFSNGSLALDFSDLALDGVGSPSSTSLSVTLGETIIDSLVISNLAAPKSSKAVGLFLDDITVSQVPEPSAIVLLGVVGVGLLLRRCR